MFPLWQSMRSEWRLSASMNQRKRKTGRVSWSIGSGLYSVLRTSVYTLAVCVRSFTNERVVHRTPFGKRWKGEAHASRSGTLRGVKPEDLVPISGTDRKDRANPATYADARNFCWKRRDDKEVKAVETLQPKGDGVGPICCKHR